MADSSVGSILKIGAIGLGAYLIYEWLFATPAAAATTTPVTLTPIVVPTAPAAVTTPATTVATPATTTTTAAAPVAPAFNSLDAIYSRLAAAAGTAPQTPDSFNYYLQQQLPAGMTAPDPLQVFTSAGFDRTQTMTLANYWGVMAPYLASNMGLSGLGVLAGLYDFMRRSAMTPPRIPGLYGLRDRR